MENDTLLDLFHKRQFEEIYYSLKKGALQAHSLDKWIILLINGKTEEAEDFAEKELLRGNFFDKDINNILKRKSDLSIEKRKWLDSLLRGESDED